MKFMDLLFQRYADPFSLIDGYIRTGRFCEFIDSFSGLYSESERWEYFLHKVWDKSYEEFKKSLQTTQDLQSMSDAAIETTVKNSLDILGNFIPTNNEGGI